MNGIITEAPRADQAEARPSVYIGLDAIRAEFPDGWWEDPAQDVVLDDGRTVRDVRIDGLALMIATSLRKQFAARRPTSGLVGPDGRPL